MPTDIAGSVVPVYTAVISRPNNGEYANETAWSACVLPIANRVEYLRARLETAPWSTFEILEDFTSVPSTFPVIADRVIFDRGWEMSLPTGWDTGSTSVAGGAGGLFLGNSSGGALNLRFQTLSDGSLAAFSQMRKMACRVSLESIASGMAFEFGLTRNGQAAPGSTVGNRHAISLIFVAASSPNWRLRTDNGAAQTFVDTGVAVVANTPYVLEIVGDGAGAISARANASTPVVASGTIPSLSLNASVSFRYGTPAAGAGRTFTTDFVAARFDCAARVF